MKYIGATDFFVRAPFVIEGIIIGLIGSMIPLVIIYFVYNKAAEFLAIRFSMLNSILDILPVGKIFEALTPISILIGVGIGFLGSVTTVRKHLHV